MASPAKRSISYKFVAFKFRNALKAWSLHFFRKTKKKLFYSNRKQFHVFKLAKFEFKVTLCYDLLEDQEHPVVTFDVIPWAWTYSLHTGSTFNCSWINFCVHLRSVELNMCLKPFGHKTKYISHHNFGTIQRLLSPKINHGCNDVLLEEHYGYARGLIVVDYQNYSSDLELLPELHFGRVTSNFYCWNKAKMFD